MLFKHHEPTKVDRRTWLHVTSGTHWLTSSDTRQAVEMKKILLLKCMHHLQTALINNMDHMRISGTEPSAVNLSQSRFKSWKAM